MFSKMPKVLIAEDVKAEDIYVEMEEEGIEYTTASRDNFVDELSTGEYSVVIGDENDRFYAAAIDYDSDIPVLDYGESGLATGFLSGNSEADINSIKRMTDNYGKIVENREREDQLDFASSVLSHDARNELNVITGMIELVREDVDGELESRLEMAESNTYSLLDIIDTTTDLIQPDRGPQEIDLSQALRDVYQNYLDEAQQKGFEMNVDIEPRLTAVAGLEVKSMYGQMVRNSFEHSEGDQIRLTAYEREDGKPRVVYEDNGEGIDDDLKRNVLQEGFSSKDGSEGGLGMYIMAQNAETHDIELDIDDSEDLGGIKISTILEPAEE